MTRPKPPGAAPLSSADDVEAQFYEALQQADLARLMAVWADDEELVCVHPGGARLVGGAAIRSSFEAVFANGAVPVQVEQVLRVRGPGVVVHHVVERVGAAGGGRQGAENCVLAVNVYVHTAQGWRLVAHHASAGPAAATQRERPTTLH